MIEFLFILLNKRIIITLFFYQHSYFLRRI